MTKREIRQHALFDALMIEYELKTDRAIAEGIGCTASYVSRMRSGKQRICASVILAIHEATDMKIEEIKRLIAEAA
jgi:transcriptional regulator with XRE-family HTH domain